MYVKNIIKIYIPCLTKVSGAPLDSELVFMIDFVKFDNN